ncbi:lipoxygenase 1, chloroplastic [Tanacetum coccineum]
MIMTFHYDLGNPRARARALSDLLDRYIRRGQKIPYPRRCRTGRAPSDTDISAESRVEKPFPLYVPRDEQFDESKQNTFSTSRLKAVLHNLLPSMVASISKKHDFKGFSQIESLYSEGRTDFSWIALMMILLSQALEGVNPTVNRFINRSCVLTPPVDALANGHGKLAKAMRSRARKLYPGRYCAAGYKHSLAHALRLESLPADHLRMVMGMAVPDPSQRHGIKLLIEDYPYASDGLLIWEAIQNWVQTYVTRYYPDPSLVCNDRELQAWYAEVINVGHADLRHENWWPTSNVEDLTAILTTIIWLASAQHAALNFGQYPYGGYIPNRPPRMRRLIPDENDPEYASFLEDLQNYFLLALPSMLRSTKYILVVDTLSTHSPDEEYIGERQQRDTWSGDAEMVEAFYGFASEIQRIEKEIEKRNRDMSLKNRCGAGVLPYELLAPND